MAQTKKVAQECPQKELEEKLSEIVSRNASNRSKAINIIKHREQSCRIPRRISQVLGRGTNRLLTKVEVPVDVDGEVVGWRIISNPDEQQREAVERNHVHLNQAKPTPLWKWTRI